MENKFTNKCDLDHNVLAGKYLTIEILKKNGEHGSVGGLRHFERVLKILVVFTKKYNIKLILPNPKRYFDFNHGGADFDCEKPGAIKETTKWSDYYDLDIDLPENFNKDNMSHTTFDILKNKLEDLNNCKSELIILRFKETDEFPRYSIGCWECFTKTSEFASRANGDTALPSNKNIKLLGKKTLNIIGDYVTIHIRRGDVLLYDNCYGTMEDFKKATSIENIFKHTKNYKKIIIFSNENREYFEELLNRTTPPFYMFETDLYEKLNIKSLDNIHSVLINSEIAKYGKKHICTHCPRLLNYCDKKLL